MRKYKKVYIYRESKFPDNGWIQPCFKCYSPTSGLFELTPVKTRFNFYEINVYLCPQCRKVFEKSSTEYNKFLERCADYMETYVRFH